MRKKEKLKITITPLTIRAIPKETHEKVIAYQKMVEETNGYKCSINDIYLLFINEGKNRLT